MITTDLSLIAAHLEGLEETIIARLIDRAQFRVNGVVYLPGSSGFSGDEPDSLFDLRLRYTEEMDARFGRFHVPEERPFTSALPPSRRAAHLPQTPLRIADFNAVSLTPQIREAWTHIVPRICREGTDGNYGSSVEHDIHALQAISRRIHYGSFFVAEAKYRLDPEHYRALIGAHDTDALMALLTRVDVEERILSRVKEKAQHQQSQVNRTIRTVVSGEIVQDLYRDYIIPLTKEGEIRYLLNRQIDNT